MYNSTRPETIQQMFAAIASGYDRANAILSFGLHKRWNAALVRAIGKRQSLVDLCAGTGEIALSYLKRNPHSQVTLLDFCPEMLEIAKEKGGSAPFTTLVADVQQIPLPSSSVEGLTMAYGIRNVQTPLLAFSEAYRILKSGGVYGILELTRPANRFLHLGHHLYLRTCLPLLGKVATNNRQAYDYLSKSIRHFASPHELKTTLSKVGFQKIDQINLMGGTATILLAHK